MRIRITLGRRAIARPAAHEGAQAKRAQADTHPVSVIAEAASFWGLVLQEGEGRDEQIAASAQELAQTATQLDALLAQFTLASTAE